MGVSKSSDHIQIKIKMPNPSQEPPSTPKVPNQDFKLKLESQYSENGCNKDNSSYPNQNQYAKPQSGNSSVLQCPKLGLRGHGWSLHLQNQDREQKFGMCVYQRLVTIFKSRSRCQTPVRNLQRPSKSKMRT